MIRALRLIAASAWFAGFLLLPAAGGEKPKPAPDGQPQPCDVYGPGYEPVGGTGICIKITGSVELDVMSSLPSGHPSVANSPDWIRTKPAKGGN